MSQFFLADAHTHLNMPEFAGEEPTIISRAWETGVRLLINIGISIDNSQAAVATAKRYPWIYATAGIHPHGADRLGSGELGALTALLQEDKVVAVGEIGLDFYRRRAPEAAQEKCFRQLLDLAVQHRKPVVIHCREATATMLEILRGYRGRLAGGMMHCFSGTYAEAREFLDLGLEISFSGVLTYPNAKPLQEAARRLPLDRLHLETDAPYLAPQAQRGRRNEPAYLIHTAQFLAALKNLTLAEVAAATWANTCRLFQIAPLQI